MSARRVVRGVAMDLDTRLKLEAAYVSPKYMAPGAGKRLAELHESQMGVDGRLPDHYRDFYQRWKIGPTELINIKKKEGIFEKDRWGNVVRVQNIKPPTFYPEEFHQGLWGGEGVIKGFWQWDKQKHRENEKVPEPHMFVPKLHETVVYSEVLNKHIWLPSATERGESLVHDAGGFDKYLLDTPVNEIYAWKLLRIKREILLALSKGDYYEDNEEKKGLIEKKFGHHACDLEVADWHGLSIHEAREKQLTLEGLAIQESKIPKKDLYRREMVEMLKEGYLDDIDPDVLLADQGYQKGTLGETFEKIKKKFE